MYRLYESHALGLALEERLHRSKQLLYSSRVSYQYNCLPCLASLLECIVSSLDSEHWPQMPERLEPTVRDIFTRMRVPSWLTGKQSQQARKQVERKHHAIHMDMRYIWHSIKVTTISGCRQLRDAGRAAL